MLLKTIEHLKKVTTSDGSNSIYLEELDEHYHSVHGAHAEAMHVFIKHGLQFVFERKDKIELLEMGFGTGLNALLTWQNVPKNKEVVYTSIEKFPVEVSFLNELNYFDKDGKYEKIINSEWNKPIAVVDCFSLNKLTGDLLNFESNARFDLIYFDAFAPRVQPELWTEEVFGKCYEMLTEKGVLVTYCAKGQVKRNMKGVGFTVERLPGPPGKREMTRAIKHG